MFHRVKTIGAALFMVAVWTSPLAAQAASLLGSVLLDGKETPLANAEILIPSLKLSTRSDSAGKFALSGIAPGKHAVTVRLIGHTPLTLDLDFKASQPGDVDFILTPTVTELKEVKVKDTKTTGSWAIKLAEFDERRAMGIGRFLTADYFDAQDGRPMSAFLAERIPGTQFIRKNGRTFIASRRGGGKSLKDGLDVLPGACYMQVVINGIMRWNGNGQPMVDVDEINSKDIIGFEFYTTATTPLQYNGTRGKDADACGTVVIWTKGG